MATKFSIHEDIENALEPTKRVNINKKAIVGGKSSNVFTDKFQQQHRPKLAMLNNIQVNGVRNTNSQKTAFAVLHQAKPNVQLKANDENALRKPGNAKIEQKPSIDQYKVFNVLKVGDENAPPTIYMDETDHAVSNSSFSGIRQPLQELKHDVETPVSLREILSPMSIDKSTIDSEANNSLLDESQNIADSSIVSLKDEMDKFFEVEEYRGDILDYLRESELRNRPKPLYMRKQPDISHSMRTILVDWLVEVGEEYSLQNETLHLAVSYIDRFLSIMSVVRAKLQLVGTAAMFIAAKYEEIYPPEVNEFVYITDNTYTRKQVLRMEQLILKVLTFDLCVPTTSVFLNAFPIVNDLSREVKFMAQYLCELSLLEAEPYLQYVPSMVASAAIALARLNFGQSIWTDELERATGYSIQKLSQLILYLSKSHCAAIDLAQQATQDKYKHAKCMEVSARKPLNVDEATLSNAIQQCVQSTDIDAHETNESVRKMISNMLSVS